MSIHFKKIIPHLIALVIFLVLPAIYFSPVFEGKTLSQNDMKKVAGMEKEQKDYYEKTGVKPQWTSSMFSGMPGYHVYGKAPQTMLHPLSKVLYLGDHFAFHIGIVFLYLLAAYIALVLLGCSPWLSLLGAVAIAFSSYQIIIIEAGHITKAWSISMFLPILVSIMLCFKRKYVIGGLLFMISLSFQIYFNHIQITYYTLIASVFLGLYYVIKELKEKQYKSLLTIMGIFIGGAGIAVMLNAALLLSNQEYAQYTMRGGHEITITPDYLANKGEIPVSDIKPISSGLDIEYAFNWSYGVGETNTLLVPGIYGGGSGEWVDKESEFYKMTRERRAPLYWGDQPFTSGPMYFGTIICFLFIFSLFVVKGSEKWWILAAFIFFIFLSWGKNFMPLNEFLFKYLPLYNKFRTPSTSLVGANILMVLMMVLGLKAVMENKSNLKEMNKALYWSGGIVGGICLFFMAFGSSLFSFTGISDTQYEQMMNPEQYTMFMNALIADRKALLLSDSFRSLLFIGLSFALLWAFLNHKIKKQAVVLGGLCVLVLFDLWGVDKRYLNEKNFEKAKRTTLVPTQNDLTIKQYAVQFDDKVYRVFNLAGNPFNDSYTSAFHHSIGGYHAAKLRRYQDLIDFYLTNRPNMNVINMLNTRYFIIPDGSGGSVVQRNPEALGNAWYVSDYTFVDNPNQEILALDKFDPSQTAIIHKRFESTLKGYENGYDSTAQIILETKELYNPDHLTYHTKTNRDQLAVFSEVYYEPDWEVFIDGKRVDYFSVNYILRGMIVPKGEHVIEFKLNTKLFNRGSLISFGTSIFVVLLIGGVVFFEFRRKKKARSFIK